jgi:hypothetical protein
MSLLQRIEKQNQGDAQTAELPGRGSAPAASHLQPPGPVDRLAGIKARILDQISSQRATRPRSDPW